MKEIFRLTRSSCGLGLSSATGRTDRAFGEANVVLVGAPFRSRLYSSFLLRWKTRAERPRSALQNQLTECSVYSTVRFFRLNRFPLLNCDDHHKSIRAVRFDHDRHLIRPFCIFNRQLLTDSINANGFSDTISDSRFICAFRTPRPSAVTGIRPLVATPVTQYTGTGTFGF